MRTRKHHLRQTHNKPSQTIDKIIFGCTIAVAIVLRVIMPTFNPFALLWIGIIYLIYSIGRQWFNRKVGMLSAAFFAVSQFSLLQTEWTYSVGLLFVLLATWFWHKIIFATKPPKNGLYIGFSLSVLACTIGQHFALIQAILIFLTGLLWVQKEQRKPYCISGITSIVLAPLAMWLLRQKLNADTIAPSLPTASFITDFIQYTMNESQLFMFATGIVILLPLILGKRDKSRNPLRWVGIAWFTIVFGAGFSFSMFQKNILCYDSLLFSYPFLIITAFSLYKNRTLPSWQNALVVAAILFAGTSSFILSAH